MNVLKRKCRKRKMKEFLRKAYDIISELFGNHHYDVDTVVYKKSGDVVTHMEKHCTCRRCGKRKVFKSKAVPTPKLFKISWSDENFYLHETYKVGLTESDIQDRLKREIQFKLPETININEVQKINGYKVSVDYDDYYKSHLVYKLFCQLTS